MMSMMSWLNGWMDGRIDGMDANRSLLYLVSIIILIRWSIRGCHANINCNADTKKLNTDTGKPHGIIDVNPTDWEEMVGMASSSNDSSGFPGPPHIIRISPPPPTNSSSGHYPSVRGFIFGPTCEPPLRHVMQGGMGGRVWGRAALQEPQYVHQLKTPNTPPPQLYYRQQYQSVSSPSPLLTTATARAKTDLRTSPPDPFSSPNPPDDPSPVVPPTNLRNLIPFP